MEKPRKRCGIIIVECFSSEKALTAGIARVQISASTGEQATTHFREEVKRLAELITADVGAFMDTHPDQDALKKGVH